MAGRRVTILVVDDDADIAAEIAGAFARKGCEVRTANSGNAARALLELESVDAVLTDIRMPDGGGVELLQWLRTSGRTTPAFVMTGYSDFALDDAMRAGTAGLFGKPFDVGHVVRTLLGQLGL